MIDYAIVIPTIGRPSLFALLGSLADAGADDARSIVIVDDRASAGELDLSDVPPSIANRCIVVKSNGRGPAAARNTGWRACVGEWVVFLDDDVIVERGWREGLERDLANAAPALAGSQARIDVPLPSDRAPTDWERNVSGLAHSVWITADMAYRRAALRATNGFDERFKRAYREDADLAIRMRGQGFELTVGSRRTFHPVRPADRWISIRLQRGNADDVLMRALHGNDWRALAGSPRGRFAMHAATVTSAALAIAAAARGRRDVATIAALAWLGLTAEFAWHRIAPGPKTREEIGAMLATSAIIPFAAVYHRASALARLPSILAEEAA